MKKAIALLLMALALTALAAQDVDPVLSQLISGVSKNYVVVKGDTLKEIAADYYGEYRFWPAVWFANRDVVSNPEIIEPGTTFKLYKLPFDAKGPGFIMYPAMKSAYAQVYERYLELGSDWIPQRRWTLLEGRYYDENLFDYDANWIAQEDRGWYVKRGKGTGLPPLASEVLITFAHTNDTHSRVIESKTEIGLSRISTLVDQLEQYNPNTYLVDCGDTFHGLPIANLERGASIAQLLNATGYNYMTTGNHDYNYGWERLLELRDMTDAKILVANVYRDGMRLFEPYEIIDIDGVKVAIFGLASPETTYKSDPKGIEGIEFVDPRKEARDIADDLAGQYDILLCIAHVGMDGSSDPTSEMVAEAVPEIDVIFDGHSHSSLETVTAENDTGTLIASADSNGVSLGVVDIYVGTDRSIITKTARTIKAADVQAVEPDTWVKSIADVISEAQAPMLAEVVGATLIDLQGKREIVRTSESNLGKLIASSMIYASDAEVAFLGGGSVRDSIPAGDITKKHVFTVLPFGNYIQTTMLKGSEFDAIVEHGVGKLPAADGRFPQFAGLTYTLDASRPAGDRVSDIMVRDEPVEADREYVFAALNFVFNGGDGFTMLTGKKLQDFPSDAEAFMDYIKFLGVVTEFNYEYK
jgi:5'-nucleotidase/UDP-sugar diphosphatase